MFAIYKIWLLKGEFLFFFFLRDRASLSKTLAILGTHSLDLAGLEPIACLCPPSAGINGVWHYRLARVTFLIISFNGIPIGTKTFMFHIIFKFSVCLRTCTHMKVPCCAQRTICGSCFSSSTFTWIMGIELEPLGMVSSTFVH